MFDRTNINLLFSICYGLIILATDFGIYILSVFLFILQDIREWGSLQMRTITGQLRATLTDDSRHPHLRGQSQIRQIGSNNPFSNVSPNFFLNQTQPGPPRSGRARRRIRERGGTPTRPLSSRAPRRPRRLLQAPLSPLSQTPPPSYTEEVMMGPQPGLDQTIATAETENVSNPKVKTQEAEEPLLSGNDQSQAELHPTPEIRHLSLVDSSPPPSTPPIPSDQHDQDM